MIWIAIAYIAVAAILWLCLAANQTDGGVIGQRMARAETWRCAAWIAVWPIAGMVIAWVMLRDRFGAPRKAEK